MNNGVAAGSAPVKSEKQGFFAGFREWLMGIDWGGALLFGVVGVIIIAFLFFGLGAVSDLLKGLWNELQQLVYAILPGSQKGETRI